MGKSFYFIIALTVLFFTGCKEKTTYNVGQEWNYKTRVGEEKSTLKILKIEDYPDDGKVIHISIENLKMNNPHIKESFVEKISHIPISEKALQKSTTTLKSENVKLPDYEEGYYYWKSEFNKGKAGIFKITVAKAVSGMEDIMKSGNTEE